MIDHSIINASMSSSLPFVVVVHLQPCRRRSHVVVAAISSSQPLVAAFRHSLSSSPSTYSHVVVVVVVHPQPFVVAAFRRRSLSPSTCSHVVVAAAAAVVVVVAVHNLPPHALPGTTRRHDDRLRITERTNEAMHQPPAACPTTDDAVSEPKV